VEVRVVAVHAAVNAHRYVLLAHFVDKSSDARRYKVCRSARNALANVPHVGAVLLRGVRQTQFIQDLAAVDETAPLVTATDKQTR